MTTISVNPVLLAFILSAVTYAFVFLLQRRRATVKDRGLQMALSESGLPVSAANYNIMGQALEQERGEELILEEEEPDEEGWELIEDDASILLKEAERVIEQVNDVVVHIASDPPNPAEVFTKIRNIIAQYSIFENTEFYDAINQFVSVTVQRELNITFSESQLQALWS